MFSNVIHLLTLAAFNVHALLGCCGHHGHEHSTCVHAEVCDSSTPHDDSHTKEVADEDAGNLIGDFAAAWLGCDHPTQSPIEHSHSCDEESCVFMVPRSAPLVYLASIMAVVPIDPWQINFDSAMPSILRTAFQSRRDFTLVGHRCALQQSWQI